MSRDAKEEAKKLLQLIKEKVAFYPGLQLVWNAKKANMSVNELGRPTPHWLRKNSKKPPTIDVMAALELSNNGIKDKAFYYQIINSFPEHVSQGFRDYMWIHSPIGHYLVRLFVQTLTLTFIQKIIQILMIIITDKILL